MSMYCYVFVSREGVDFNCTTECRKSSGSKSN